MSNKAGCVYLVSSVVMWCLAAIAAISLVSKIDNHWVAFYIFVSAGLTLDLGRNLVYSYADKIIRERAARREYKRVKDIWGNIMESRQKPMKDMGVILHTEEIKHGTTRPADNEAGDQQPR